MIIALSILALILIQRYFNYILKDGQSYQGTI